MIKIYLYKDSRWYYLVGGFNHLEKYEFVNGNEFVNGKDDIPYIMENRIHVPNHQPVMHFDLQKPCAFFSLINPPKKNLKVK